jgi:multiple sugar transport system substrate-binding protein
MTHNATISIAAKWFDDMNNASLKPESAADEEELLRADPTSGFPNKPDGSPWCTAPR